MHAVCERWVERRVNVELELAIVVDWNAAVGTGGVLRILSGFRTLIIAKNKNISRFILT